MSADDTTRKDAPDISYIPVPKEELDSAVENVQELLSCLQSIPMPQTGMPSDFCDEKTTNREMSAAKLTRWSEKDQGNIEAKPTSVTPVNPGVENARKKLRAFAIQKKHAQAVSLAAASVVKRPIKTVKKTSKFLITRMNTVSEIEKIKQITNRYDIALRLDIPLWMCPPNKSLDSYSMPTKSMPPPKTLLSHEQMDELIKNAEKYEQQGIPVRYVMDRTVKEVGNIKLILVRQDNLQPVEPKKEEPTVVEAKVITPSIDKSRSRSKSTSSRTENKRRSSERRDSGTYKKKEHPPKTPEVVPELDGYVVCDSWSPENDSRDDSSIKTKVSDLEAQKDVAASDVGVAEHTPDDFRDDVTNGCQDSGSQINAVIVQDDMKALNIVAEYSSDSLEDFPYDDNTVIGSPVSDRLSSINKHSIYSPDPLSTSGSPESRSEKSFDLISVASTAATVNKTSTVTQKHRCLEITPPTDHFLDLVETAIPSAYGHSYASCTKKTISQPVIEYSNNPKMCKCFSSKLLNLKTLIEQKNLFLETFPSLDNPTDIQPLSSREWYQSLQYALTDRSTIELSTNWETDDSTQDPPRYDKTSTTQRPYRRHPNEVVIDIAEISLPPIASYSDNVPNKIHMNVALKESSLDMEYDRFLQAVWSSGNRSAESTSGSKTTSRTTTDAAYVSGSDNHSLKSVSKPSVKNCTFSDGDFGEDSMEDVIIRTPLIERNIDVHEKIVDVASPVLAKKTSSEYWSEESTRSPKQHGNSSLSKKISIKKKKISPKKKKNLKDKKKKRKKVKKKQEKRRSSSDTSSESDSSQSSSTSDVMSKDDSDSAKKKKKRKRVVLKKSYKKKVARLKRLNKKKKLKRLKAKQKKLKAKTLHESDKKSKEDDKLKQMARSTKRKESKKSGKPKKKRGSLKQKDKPKKRRSTSTSETSSSSSESSEDERINISKQKGKKDCDAFSIKTLMNIKRERISDEEVNLQSVADFSPRRNKNNHGTSQEIISVSELHSDFVENNQLINIKKEPVAPSLPAVSVHEKVTEATIEIPIQDEIVTAKTPSADSELNSIISTEKNPSPVSSESTSGDNSSESSDDDSSTSSSSTESEDKEMNGQDDCSSKTPPKTAETFSILNDDSQVENLSFEETQCDLPKTDHMDQVDIVPTVSELIVPEIPVPTNNLAIQCEMESMIQQVEALLQHTFKPTIEERVEPMLKLPICKDRIEPVSPITQHIAESTVPHKIESVMQQKIEPFIQHKIEAVVPCPVKPPVQYNKPEDQYSAKRRVQYPMQFDKQYTAKSAVELTAVLTTQHSVESTVKPSADVKIPQKAATVKRHTFEPLFRDSTLPGDKIIEFIQPMFKSTFQEQVEPSIRNLKPAPEPMYQRSTEFTIHTDRTTRRKRFGPVNYDVQPTIEHETDPSTIHGTKPKVRRTFEHTFEPFIHYEEPVSTLAASDNVQHADSTVHAIETVVTSAIARGEIKCDWRPSEISSDVPERQRKPSRWGVTPQEPNQEDKHRDQNAEILDQGKVFRIKSVLDTQSPEEVKFYDTPEEKMVYKIETISSMHKYPGSSPSSYDTAYAVMFGEADHLAYGDCFAEATANNEEVKISRKADTKISLDDRINMALKYLGGEEEKEENDKKEKVIEVKKEVTPLEDPPNKGILVMVTAPKASRFDPRISKAGKRVSFADGFAPGQDSDIEEPPAKRVKEVKDKQPVKYGCAWPCPPWHEDYDPEWDALPPPPPPLGSPPPPSQPPMPPLHLLRGPLLHSLHRGTEVLVPPHQNNQDEKSEKPTTQLELQQLPIITRLPKGLGHPNS